MGQAAGTIGSGIGAIGGTLLGGPGLGTSLGATLGGGIGGALGGGTNPQNTWVGPPGQSQLNQGYMSMIGGGQGFGSNSPFSTLLGLTQGMNGGTSGLQRQATGTDQYSNQMSPEMRAMSVAMPALQNILSGAGQASGLNALQPVFQQNLAQAGNQLTANAPGGRFSSGMLQAQAGLGQKSLNDFNLLAQQMLQQGMSNQIGAANSLNGLGNSAGQAQMQALQMLLGPALQNIFSGTMQQQQSGLQQGLGVGSSLAQLMMLLGNQPNTGANFTVPQLQTPFLNSGAGR